MINAKIIKIDELTRDVLEIHAQIQDNALYKFIAGQFCMIYIENKDEIIERAFSFSGDESDTRNARWLIKIRENGKASNFFKTCKHGDMIKISNARGQMILPKILPQKIVFIATSVGIAPFLSMIRKIKNVCPKTEVIVIFGLRNENDIFAIDELEMLETTMPNMKHICALSKPSEKWKGQIGRVTDHIKDNIYFDDTLYYLCGNMEMVIDARKLLLSSDIQVKNIRFEIFTPHSK